MDSFLFIDIHVSARGFENAYNLNSNMIGYNSYYTDAQVQLLPGFANFLS